MAPYQKPRNFNLLYLNLWIFGILQKTLIKLWKTTVIHYGYTPELLFKKLWYHTKIYGIIPKTDNGT